jgi:hypothetical protein
MPGAFQRWLLFLIFLRGPEWIAFYRNALQSVNIFLRFLPSQWKGAPRHRDPSPRTAFDAANDQSPMISWLAELARFIFNCSRSPSVQKGTRELPREFPNNEFQLRAKAWDAETVLGAAAASESASSA